ncbi:MAG: T9SS type A sorting domain-containing protein, partial [Cyclobacteriaceae bacterium]
ANPAFTTGVNCNAVSFTSDPSTVGNPFSHNWDVDNDGVWDYFTDNPVHTFGVNGTYQVVHEVNNGCGTFTTTQPVTISNNTLSLNVVSSATGPLVAGNTFNVDVTVTNISGAPITNIVVDLPLSPLSTGLSYTFTPTTIPVLNAGQSQLITVPVTVTGTCGEAYICAEITGADNACLIPATCSDPIIIQSNTPLDQAVQINHIITNTYAAPFVTGGLVEFEVIVTNQTANTLTNIDLNYFPSGLNLQTSAPASFTLAANASNTFTVVGKVLDCIDFTLDSEVAGIDNTCPGTAPSATISGQVTPFAVNVVTADKVCNGTSSVQATVEITNPSSQTITDVTVLPTGSSNLFQNLNGSLRNLTLTPNSTTTAGFTYDVASQTGSAFICADIASIGTGSDLISYSCSNSLSCTPVSVVDNPVTITINSSPPDGTHRCFYQNPRINYFIDITNNLPVPLNNLPTNTIMSGLTVVNNQSIPPVISIPANGTLSYVIATDVQSPAGSGDLTIDVTTGIPGCNVATASTSHPIFYTVNDVLSSSAVIVTPGPYVYGQTVAFDVTVNNTSPYQINGIELNGVDISFANSLGNISQVPLFDLAPGASAVQTITATLTNCTIFDFYGQITQTASTCFGNLRSNTVSGTLNPLSLTTSPISFTCDGQSNTLDVQVNSPAGTVVNDVFLSVTGSQSGSMFSGIPGNIGPLSLSPGINNFTIPVTALNGMNGTENLCVEIDRIGNLPYNCVNTSSCQSATVGELIETSSYTIPFNTTSVCPGQYVNFVTGIINKHSVPITVTYNNTLSGGNVGNPQPLSGTITLNPGQGTTLTYVVQVSANANIVDFQSSFDTGLFQDCAGNSIFTEQTVLTVKPTVQQALTLSTSLTNTYPAPYVLGGEVEFEVTVSNQTATAFNNVSLNLANTGLDNVTASSTNFNLAANATTSILVSGTVNNCTAFDLNAAITGVPGTCGGSVSDLTAGTVTPYGISLISTPIVCGGASNIQADLVIVNPSGQTISDVNLSALQGSTLFQNVSTISPLTLLPGNNTISFTFDSNGNQGTENVCVDISSIGSGINSIPYSCSTSSACDQTVVVGSPLQVSLTANPSDGTTVCVDQNPLIDYTLTITNATTSALSGISVNAILSGVSLNAGQTIPATVSVLAGSTQIYQFSGTAINTFSNASVQIAINSGIVGCSNSSVMINHPLRRDLNNILQVNTVPVAPGPYTMGEQIDYQVTVTNLTSSVINNIDLDYQHLGLTNTTLSPINFSLGAGATGTFPVSAVIDDCQLVEFTARILSADQTCVNMIPASTVNTTVTPYTVQLSGPAFTCAGSTVQFTADVFHPGSIAVSGVEITLTGGTGFSGLPTTQVVTLQPGNNSIPINSSTAIAFNGTDNLCATITSIGGSPYNCPANQACTPVTITDTPLSISVQQSGSGLLCGDGTAAFDLTVTNLTAIDLTGIDFGISGSSGFTPNNLPMGINLLANSSQTFTFDGTIPAGTSSMSFCVDVVSIGNLSCATSAGLQGCVSNAAVNSMSLPIEIEDAITGPGGSLSLEVIYDMTLDDQGNMYAVGVMRGAQVTVQGGGSNTYTATSNCSLGMNPFVLKYDNSGVSWFRTIDACGLAIGVAVDASGEVFVALNTLSDINFAGSTYTKQGGFFDFAVLRYDAAGNEQMYLAEGGEGDDYIADIKVNNGKIVVTGTTIETPPVLQPAGYNNQYTLGGQGFTYHHYLYQQNNSHLGDGFTASYQYNATAITNDWVDVIAAPLVPNKLAVEPNGNIYVIGAALETFAFPHFLPGGGGQIAVNAQYAGGIPAATSQPNVNIDIDAFIISYTSSGSNRWGRLYGSLAMDYPETVANTGSNTGSLFHQTDIRISASGQLYAALQSYATYTGSPVAGSALSFQTQMGSHIVNLNAADGTIGANEWSVPAAMAVSRTFTSTVGTTTYTQTIVGNSVLSPSIAIDDSEQIYLTGSYYMGSAYHESLDFYSASGGPAPLLLAVGANEERGIVIEKFDQNGNFVWAEPNRTWALYTGPYHPTLTPGNNPLRPLDLEVNGCGIYQTVIMDGTLTVGGTTYSGAPYDSYIFRIKEDAGGLVYGRTDSGSALVPILSEEKEPTVLTVYPNPNRGRFMIALSGDEIKENSRLMVYHMNGILLKTIEVEQAMHLELDFSDQTSGMYFIKLINGNEVITKSVVVQK